MPAGRDSSGGELSIIGLGVAAFIALIALPALPFYLWNKHKMNKKANTFYILEWRYQDVKMCSKSMGPVDNYLHEILKTHNSVDNIRVLASSTNKHKIEKLLKELEKYG